MQVDLQPLSIRVRRGRSLCESVSGLPRRAGNFSWRAVISLGQAVRHGTLAALATPVRDFAVTSGTQILGALAAVAVMDQIDAESPEAAMGAQLATLVGLPIAIYGAGVRWRQLEPGDQRIWLGRALNLVNVVGIPLASAHFIAGQQPTQEAAYGAISSYLIRGTLSRFSAQFARDFFNFVSNAVMPTVEPRYCGMPLVVGSDLYNRYTATRLGYATSAYAMEVGVHQLYLRDEIKVWLCNAGVDEATAELLAPALSAGIAEAADAFTGVAAHYYAAAEHGLDIHIARPKGTGAWKDASRYVATHGSMRVFYFQLVEMFISASSLLPGGRYSLPWIALRGSALVPHIASESRGRYASESMSIRKRRETWVQHEENLADHLAEWTRLAKGPLRGFSTVAELAVRRLVQDDRRGVASRGQGPLLPPLQLDQRTGQTAQLLLRTLMRVIAGTDEPRPTPREMVENLLDVFNAALAEAGVSLPDSDRVPAEIYSNSVVNAFIDILATSNLLASADTADAGEILATAAIAAVHQPARLKAFNVFDGSANHNQTMLVPAPAGYDAGQHGHSTDSYVYSLATGLREGPRSRDMNAVRENMGSIDVQRGRLNRAAEVLADEESLNNATGNHADSEANQAASAVLGALSYMHWSQKIGDEEMEDYLVKTVRSRLGESRGAHLSDDKILNCAFAVLVSLKESESGSDPFVDAKGTAEHARFMARRWLAPQNNPAAMEKSGAQPASLLKRFRQVRRETQVTARSQSLLGHAADQIRQALASGPQRRGPQYVVAQHLLRALVSAEWAGTVSDAVLSQYLVTALRRDLAVAGVTASGDDTALMESLLKLLELSCSSVADADEHEVALGRAALSEAAHLIDLPNVPAVPGGADAAPLRMHTTTATSSSSSSTVPAPRTPVHPVSAANASVELARVRSRTEMASPQPARFANQFGRLRQNIAASGSWQGRTYQAAGAINQVLERTRQAREVYPAAAVAHSLLSALISVDWKSRAPDTALMDELAVQFRLSPNAGAAAHLTDDQIFQAALALMERSLSVEAKEAQAVVGPWLADAAIQEVGGLLGAAGLVRKG
ncbi:hypothetical protein BH11PSE7_BH11PSE7_00630 [soil metagenome]